MILFLKVVLVLPTPTYFQPYLFVGFINIYCIYSLLNTSSVITNVGFFFINYHLGIYNEDVTIFLNSWVCVFDNIVFLIPLGYIYARTFISRLNHTRPCIFKTFPMVYRMS